MMKNDIVLSICLCGRNDHYGHDFKRRFKLSMDFLAWSAQQAGVLDKLEVVFCDWNSAAPLHEVIQLTPAASKMVRFVIVPPQIAKQQNFSSNINTCAAFNVSARRAHGHFVAISPSDILYPRWSISSLIALLCSEVSVPFDIENSVMLVPRKLLDSASCDAAYFCSPEAVENLLFNSASYLLSPSELSPGLNAGAALQIFPKKLFECVRGNNEKMWGWGVSDMEVALRLSHYAKVYSLEACGVIGYDFLADTKMLKEKKERFVSISSVHHGFAENTSAWGCGIYTLQEKKAAFTDSFGAMPEEKRFPEYLPTQSVRNIIIERFPSIFIENGPVFSAFTMASAAMQIRFSPRRIALFGIPDPCVCSSFALGDQYSDITIVDASDGNLLRLTNISNYMNKRGFGYKMYHHGHVHLYPDIPESPESFGAFDLLLLNERLISDKQLISFLNPGGIILSSYEIKELSLPHTVVRGVHIYTEKKIPDASLLHREWLPANGNLFSPILRRMNRPFRMLALLARLPLREWGIAFKLSNDFFGRFL